MPAYLLYLSFIFLSIPALHPSYLMLAGHDGETDHALRMLRTARDMIALVQNPLPQGERVNIRVGLNTGPAHSGVSAVSQVMQGVFHCVCPAICA